MYLHEFTLAAGEQRQIGSGAHSQIFILECSKEFIDARFQRSKVTDVRLYKGVPAQIDYENVVITNPHSVSVDVKIYTAPKGMLFSEGRNVEAGPTSILGNVGVIGQPLTSDGGSITPLGDNESNHSGITSNVTVVTGAANTNGLIVRTAVFSVVSTGANTLNSLPDVGNRKFFMVARSGDQILDREHYVAAGGSLEIHMSGGNLNAYITYDLL